MTEFAGDIPQPQNAQESLEVTSGLIYDVSEYAQTQVDLLGQSGASPEEMAELTHISEKLREVSERALEVANLIDQADIQVLQPEVVDKDRIYNTLLDWFDISPLNTLVTPLDAQDYLANQGINVELKQISRWMTSWKQELTEDLQEGGRNVAFDKIANARELGLPQNSFVIGPGRAVPKRRPAAVPRPAPEPPAQQRPAASSAPAKARETQDAVTESRAQQIGRIANSLVAQEPGLPAQTYHKMLKAHPDIIPPPTAEEVQRTYEAQVAGKDLHTYSARGYVRYVIDQAQAEERRPGPVAEQTRKKREMSPEDQRLAAAMMEALVTLGKEYGRGITIDGLLLRPDLVDNDQFNLSEKALKRVASALRTTGVIEAGTPDTGHGRAKYRVRAASNKMHLALLRPDLREQILAAARERRRFHLPPELDK